MKILKVTLISILVLVLVLVGGLIVFVKTFDINRYKPQIVSQAGSALNRSVDFGKAQLALSLSQGISLRVHDLVIADDPAFAQDAFFTAKDISLSVDVLGFLLHKKISISSILIDGFRVKLIRHKDGSLNVQSIAQPAAASQTKEQTAQKALPPPSIPTIFVSSFKGTNGEVTYRDHSSEPLRELVVSNFNFYLSKISLSKRFPFEVEAAVLSAQKNIRFSGQMQVNLNAHEVTLSEFKGQTDLSQILLEKIPVSFPQVQGAALPSNLKGTVSVTLEKMTAGPTGLTELTGDVSLADASLQLKQMALPVEDVQAHAKVSEKAIILDTISASIGDGTIKGTGSMDDYLARQKFDMAFNVNNLKLADLVSPGVLPVEAQGIASCGIQLQGEGFTSQALFSLLSGTGTISFKQIVLKDINVFQQVLGKLSMIPGLSQNIETAFPERYAQALGKKDTALSDMELPFTIKNGRVNIKDLAISAEAFSLKSSAEAGFDGSYAMEGSFLIPGDLSAAMVSKVPELQYLLSEDKQIFIPLKISGKPAGASFSVDAGYIAQRLLTSQAKSQLLKVIDKAIGTKEPSGVSSSAPQTTNEAAGVPGQSAGGSGDKKQSSPEDLASSILGSILKK